MAPIPSGDSGNLFDLERLRTAWVGERRAGSGRAVPAPPPPPLPAPVALLGALRGAVQEAVGLSAPAMEQLLDRADSLVATVSGPVSRPVRGRSAPPEDGGGADQPDEEAAPPEVTPGARQAALAELEVVLDQIEDLLEALALGPQRRLGLA